MKNTGLIVFLIIVIALAFYFLGKKNGSNNSIATMVENVDLIKTIAELSALEVNGSLNLKISNKVDEAGTWEKFKNYFVENTLQVNLPYQAKYGVDISTQKMKIDTKEKTATITLPKCKLLSLQLKLDAMQTMSQTGVFASASMDDLVKAQKQLYTQALQKLDNDANYIKLAETQIANILANYYKPLGYRVSCVFEDNQNENSTLKN